MDGINNPKSQLVYPFTDKKTDTFMIVINLPNVVYDEIIVSIEPSYVEVMARLCDRDPLLSLINESYSASQIYTTKVSTPLGLDIENATAFYDNGAVTVYLPYC